MYCLVLPMLQVSLAIHCQYHHQDTVLAVLCLSRIITIPITKTLMLAMHTLPFMLDHHKQASLLRQALQQPHIRTTIYFAELQIRLIEIGLTK